MLTKSIKYTDFNGESREETFYFNLTQAEAFAIELGAEGNSFTKQLEKIAAERNGRKIIEAFQQIIAAAYGEKSADGRSFRKSEAIMNDFKSTEAYSVLFMELATDANKAAEFINGIAPRGLDTVADSFTASEEARRRSEASMQGHQQPKQREPETVRIEAEPAPAVVDEQMQHVPSVETPSLEEYEAWKREQIAKRDHQ